MAGRCPEGHYLDALVKKCQRCHLVCQQPHVITTCTRHCESARCKALPGHYYDRLLKKCVRCAEVCGRHPAECSQHCHAMSPPVATTTLLVKVSSRVPSSRGLLVPLSLEDSTVLLYSLLALSMVLLFSSLSLALVVFLRGSRAKTATPGGSVAKHSRERKDVGLPADHPLQTSKGSSRPADQSEPPEESSPTETCVCVHCFPDLRALSQGSDRPLREPSSFYQQPVLPGVQIQKDLPLWTDGGPHASGLPGPVGGSTEIRSICSLSNGRVSQEQWNG